MNHGFTAATKSNTISGPGVLLHAGRLLGVSRGPATFTPGKQIRNMEFDGKQTDLAGADVIDGYASTIAGTFLEASDANLSMLEHGAVLSAAPDPVLTPLAAGSFFDAETNYAKDVQLILRRGDGKYISIEFDYALVSEYSVKPAAKGEAEVSLTFMARLNPTGNPLNLNAAPYKVTVLAAFPALV